MTKKPTRITNTTLAQPVCGLGRNGGPVPAKALNLAVRRSNSGEPAANGRHKRNDAAKPPDLSKRSPPRATVKVTADATTAPEFGRGTKKTVCLTLLGRVEGASIEELMLATGWQAHSVRGFLSGEVHKRMGQELTSVVTEQGERHYRIAKVIT